MAIGHDHVEKGSVIAATASVSKSAKLGQRIRIGPGAVIGDGVEIGNNCFVGSGSIIGEPTRDYYKNPDAYAPPPTRLGDNCIIRAHCCVYAGASIGDEFECGSYVQIREGSAIEKNCKVGSYCDIQGECRIGQGCRLHSSVHVAQYSSIGNYVWLFPYTLLLNAPIAPLPPGLEMKGPTIGDYSVILSRSMLMPGIHLGIHAVVAANSRVAFDVKDWTMVAGDPAKIVCDSRKVAIAHQGVLYKPYPWMKHRPEMINWPDRNSV